MRIAVMGTGGLGGYFGGLLARAGEEVTFIARGAQLEALRQQGLTVKSQSAGTFTLPVIATDDPGGIPPVDLVLFCVKDYDTDLAARRVQPLVGPRTMLLSLQNGIDNEARIARIVGEEAVLGAVAQVSARIDAPGVIVQPGPPGKITFGELDGTRSPRAERLLETFTQAGLLAELSDNVRLALWRKFAFICAVSGVTALTRLPLGPIRACPETAEFFRQTVEEVTAIARAKGIDLPAGFGEQALHTFKEPEIRGSMAFDLLAGRRLELETLNGTVVRLGRDLALPTPCNFAIYASLKPYEDGPPTLA